MLQGVRLLINPSDVRNHYQRFTNRCHCCFAEGGEDRVGLGTDERHQAHLAATSQGRGGGRIHGFLQNLLEGERCALSRVDSHPSARSLLGYISCYMF